MPEEGRDVSLVGDFGDYRSCLCKEWCEAMMVNIRSFVAAAGHKIRRGLAMARNRDWSAVIVAVSFIALVALIFNTTMHEMSNTDDFLKIWAAVGPIVGVVTGLIPAHFFRNMAMESSDRADRNSEKMGEYKGMLLAHDIDPAAGTVDNKSQETDETPI
jgi:ABC-type nickel/cobalt efflux system permease component RcnA